MSFLKLIWPFPLFLLSALYLCWFRLRRAGRIQRTPSPFPLSNREAHSSRGSSTVRLLIMSSVFFISDFVCVCIFLYCVFIVFALRDFFFVFRECTTSTTAYLIWNFEFSSRHTFFRIENVALRLYSAHG